MRQRSSSMRCVWKSIAETVGVRDRPSNRIMTRWWARHLGCSLIALSFASAPSVANEVTVLLEAVSVPVVADTQPSLQTLEWVQPPGRSRPEARSESDWRRRWRSRRSFTEPYWRDPMRARGSWSWYNPAYRPDRFRGDRFAIRRVAPAYGSPSYMDRSRDWRDRDRWSDRPNARREWYYEGGWWWPPETWARRR